MTAKQRPAAPRVRTGVTTVLALLFAATVLLLAALALPSPAGASAPTCRPGTGAKLAGKHLDGELLAQARSLRCADLRDAVLAGADLTQADLAGALATGADFSKAHLGQADLSGAKLTHARFGGADLTQATLTGADFTGAELAHANLTQAEADGTTWTGADLTGVDATQAELKDARFDHAQLGGADFTQADTAGASFAGARGLTPWSEYVLIAAGAVFVLLALLSVRTALRRRPGPAAPGDRPATASGATVQGSYVSGPYQSIWNRPPAAPAVQLAEPTAALEAFHPINPSGRSTRGPGAALAIGLLGSLLVAAGLHLFLGGAVGSFSFAFDTLATLTCSAPQCAVGVDSGTLGLVGGVFVVIAGFLVRSRA